MGWGIASSLIAAGHDVQLFATDGIEHLPKHLLPYLVGWTPENQHTQITGRLPDKDYDCQISYTQMKNFPFYLGYGKKNRFGIWAWEYFNAFPIGYMKNYQYCDALLAPSVFAKDVFLEAKIPDNHIKIIPHGVNKTSYEQITTIDLPTKCKYKILANIAQNHLRKNIPGLLDAYGKAFTNKNDVCLLLKARPRAPVAPCDVSIDKCIKDFNDKYPDHAELKIISNFIDDISDLYRSVDTVYTMAHSEAFYFPGLEALCSGKLNICPRYGGQLDFLNDSNALLIDNTQEVADPRAVYFYKPGEIPKSKAIWCKPSIDDAVDKLRYAYANYEALNTKLEANKSKVLEEYGWDTITQRIMKLCN